MSTASLKILIIEDNEVDTELYQRLLNKSQNYHFEFVLASSAKQGLKRYKKTLPDCILVDYNLPDINGLEFVAELNHVVNGENLPAIVMLTGLGSTQIAVEAMKSGVFDYLIKCEITEFSLTQTVEAAVEKGNHINNQLCPLFQILVIEDNPVDAELYQRLLNNGHYNKFEFEIAPTGEEGLALFQQYHPDCILLDYNLPDCDGLEFLADLGELQSEYNEPLPVVVMLTGQGNESIAVEAMKLGVQDYLVKGDLKCDLLQKSVINAIEKNALLLKISDKSREFQEFSHAVSHDLQAPLRRTAQFCQLLVDENNDALSASAHNYIRNIHTNVASLQKLVKDLLSYFAIEKNEEQFSMVALDDAITIAMSNLACEIEQFKPQVHFENMPEIHGNISLLTILFQNLLHNAIKFCDQSPIKIEISAMAFNNHWRIALKDNGIGVERKHSHSVFIAFKRLHSADKYPGTGLGLAICQKIVRIHNGSIWLESPEGKGTTFYCTFPKAY